MLKLSVTEWIVLALIDEQDRHGFSIARELKAGGPIGEVWTVPRPLVYRAIQRLEADGLIEPVLTERGDKGANRTIYSISSGARNSLAKWLGEPVDHPRDARTELMAKILLLARQGRRADQLAARQLEHFQPALLGLQRKAAEAEGSEHIVALLRLESLKAIIRVLKTIGG